MRSTTNRGARSNVYSRSKYTNWTRFDPWELEVGAARRLFKHQANSGLCIQAMPVHRDFIMPLDEKLVRQVLETLPSASTTQLRAIYLLGGSNKQRRSLSGFRYGAYYGDGLIVLHAFPRDRLRRRLSHQPKPNIVHELTRVGARLINENGATWVIFDEESLSNFYAQDVLPHEVGHHADSRVWTRPRRDAEAFAEWFAIEYGFRQSDRA